MLTGAVRSRGAIYHYVAGAEVHALSEIPEGMVSLTLPQRPYAVYRHHGRLQREARDETYFQALERLRRQNIDHDPDAYCLETFRYEEKQPGGFGDCHIWYSFEIKNLSEDELLRKVLTSILSKRKGAKLAHMLALPYICMRLLLFRIYGQKCICGRITL